VALSALQSEFGIERLIYVDFHIRPPLDVPGSHVRESYYSVTGTPTVYFNGGDRIVGSNPPPYDRYKNVIERLLADSAAISISMSATRGDPNDPPTLTVDLAVARGETIAEPHECTVRVVLYEDDVATEDYGSFHHAARSLLLERELPIGESGTSAMLSEEVDLDPTWKEEDLQLIAWVQRDTNREVLNATSLDWTTATPVETTSWGAIKAAFRAMDQRR